MMQRISVPYLKIFETKYAIGGQTLKIVSATNERGWTKMLTKHFHLKCVCWWYVSTEKKVHPNPPMATL